jgi:hypothetical protein
VSGEPEKSAGKKLPNSSTHKGYVAMKKEYLILILIIVILAGYLVLKKEDGRHYTLPEPPSVDTEKIDRLTVAQTDQTLDFVRTESGWTVTEHAYPADDGAVKKMLDVMSGLTLSALVSEKQDVVRYELDPSRVLTVTAFQKDTPVMSFKIGKTAPTFNHTFVMLENDPNIYHANDNFRSHFNKSMDEFRDRQVLSFQEKDIEKITLQTPEKQVVLTARKPAEDKEEQDSTPVFDYPDGSSPDPKTVSNLLYSLSALTCDRFATDTNKADLKALSPRLAVILDNGTSRVLTLFEPDGDESVPATSSMNDYVFFLKPQVAEDITSYALDLAGLTPPEEEETKE